MRLKTRGNRKEICGRAVRLGGRKRVGRYDMRELSQSGAMIGGMKVERVFGK
jgi:hypothetical protein